MADTFVIVASYPNLALARLAQEELAAASIPARVDGAIMNLGVDAARACLLVEAPNLERARAIVGGGSVDVDDRRCPSCGENVPGTFTACWNCQSDLDGAPMSSPIASTAAIPATPTSARASRLPWLVAALAVLVAAGLFAYAEQLRADVAMFPQYSTFTDEGMGCRAVHWRGTFNKAVETCRVDGGRDVRSYNHRGELRGLFRYNGAHEGPHESIGYDKSGAMSGDGVDDDYDENVDVNIAYDKAGKETGRAYDLDGDGRREKTVQWRGGGRTMIYLDTDEDGFTDRMELRDHNDALIAAWLQTDDGPVLVH